MSIMSNKKILHMAGSVEDVWPGHAKLCSRSSQGHDLYKLCRAALPHASCKFQNHRHSGSGEEVF